MPWGNVENLDCKYARRASQVKKGSAEKTNAKFGGNKKVKIFYFLRYLASRSFEILSVPPLLARGSSMILNQPVAGSIMVRHIKSKTVSSLALIL